MLLNYAYRKRNHILVSTLAILFILNTVQTQLTTRISITRYSFRRVAFRVLRPAYLEYYPVLSSYPPVMAQHMLKS